MARKLKPSPLPDRIAPAAPLRNWLWANKDVYDGIWVPADGNPAGAFTAYMLHHKILLRTTDGCCLLFQYPVALDPAQLGAALPLKAIGENDFSSYDRTSMQRNGSVINRLYLVRGGQQFEDDLTQAEIIDPLDFWDLRVLVSVQSAPLKTITASVQGKAISQPKKPTVLKQITSSKPVFADVHTDIQAAPDEKISDILRTTARFIRSILATAIVLAFIILGLAFALGTVSMGARGGPLGLIIALILVYWLAKLFVRPRTVGRAGVKGGTTTPKYKKPGMFAHLKSWALWNTGLGDRLRTELERHMKDVSRMIDRGEIDKALKRAVALGEKDAAQKRRKSAPVTSVPKPRGSLDLDVSGIDPPSASILSENGYDGMRQQYISLAQKLSTDGDHRRAAFIYAELLKDVPKALIELEAMKAYEDAAKLATARKSPGHVAARLWFLAGKKEIALALAKQFDAMEYIANIAEKNDPDFSAFIRGHWIEMLIGAGDLTRAVIQSSGRPQLYKIHVAVLKQAVMAGLLNDQEVLEAATIALDWRITALDLTYDTAGLTYLDMLEARLNQLINGGDVSDFHQRQSLLNVLYLQHNTENSFWVERAPALTDSLIRATLFTDADNPEAPPVSKLTRYAKKIGSDVMAEDLRQIQRGKPVKQTTQRSLPLPKTAPNHADWSMIACASNERTLVATTDGEITLIDPDGNRLWTDHMTDLVGIVTVGAGRLMILVQGRTTERTLTVLDTNLHSYKNLGQLQLTAWHTQASPTSWMVQSPDVVGALDVSTMLDATASFDLLWSIAQTIPLVVLGFRVSSTAVSWVTQRTQQGKPGLIELWELDQARQELKVQILDPSSDDTRVLYEIPHLWMANKVFISQDKSATMLKLRPASIVMQTYSYEHEKRILLSGRGFFASLEQFATLTTINDGQSYAIHEPDAPTSSVAMLPVDGRWQANLQGASMLSQMGSSDGMRVAIIDERKRVICCNFREQSLKIAKV